MSQYQQQQPRQRSQHEVSPPGGTGQLSGQVQQQQRGGGSMPEQPSQETMLFSTKSHLPEATRQQIIHQLNLTLADTTVLLTHARFAHWNVKGMAFYGLHDLFEEIAETLEEHVDLIAERITALGGQAMGTAGMAVRNCGLPSFPTDITTGQEFVQVLSGQLAIHNSKLDTVLAMATEWNDLDTADLLNEVSRETSKALWFLEAHIQTQPISTMPIESQQPQGQPKPQGQPQPQPQPQPKSQSQPQPQPQTQPQSQSQPQSQGQAQPQPQQF